MRLLAVHSSAELYGSDRCLLEFASLRPVGIHLSVVLPEHGPLVDALRRAGAEVRVDEVCKIQRSMLSPRGLLRTALAAGSAVRSLRRLHEERGFDLVYSNSVAILGGALAARAIGLPHVWHVREILAGNRVVSAALRVLVRALSTRVIANSGPTLAWITGGEPVPEDERFVAVWDGYDRPERAVDPAATRAELGAAAGDVLVGMVGRINAWKGQRLLIEAFASLVRERPELPLRLAIVGSAFEGQQHFETALERAIAASGVADRIVWQRFRADVESVWAACDVAVVPSTEPEPFGRVAIEAMAFGKPVIAAAHGGLVEIVEHERSGLLVPPRDAPMLRAALERLAGDPMLRESMGRAGRQRELASFSVQRNVDRIVAVLNAAVAPGAAQPGRAVA